MQSVFGSGAPVVGLETAKKPWQKLDWNPDVQRRIYKCWGNYYNIRRRDNSALHYYTAALNIDETDFDTLYNRSLCKRKAAKAEDALKDVQQAAELAKKELGYPHCNISLAVCDSMYEMSQFENALVELQNSVRHYVGNKTKDFNSRLIVVEGNMTDALSDIVGPFFFEHEKLIKKIVDAMNIDINRNRPLWKVLKDQALCDVVSIISKEEKLISPLEIARRKRAFNVFNQCYLQRSWVDVVFIKSLRKHPNLILKYVPVASMYVKKLLNTQYTVIKSFLKMLHARAPMYYLRDTTFPDKKLFTKCREDFLYRIQYQTRRNMYRILQTIKQYRERKQHTKLEEFVEQTMGSYLTIKTFRVMPWKIEFLNEVYNTLALAYAEQYSLPAKVPERRTLRNLLRLPPLMGTKEMSKFVFGDRSTYQEKNLMDPVAVRARNMILHLERRLKFSKYLIEKTYIYHQIAQIHFRNGRNDECCFNSRKAIDAAKKCNNHLWNFLAHMLICKSHATLLKIERCRDILDSAIIVANDLKNSKLIEFIETCIHSNRDEIQRKLSKSVTGRSHNTNQSLASSMSSKDNDAISLDVTSLYSRGSEGMQ